MLIVLLLVSTHLKRPGRSLDKIQESLDRGYVPRPEYAGNFEKASGEKPGGQSRRWNLWGLLKKHYFPKSVWFFAVYDAKVAKRGIVLAFQSSSSLS